MSDDIFDLKKMGLDNSSNKVKSDVKKVHQNNVHQNSDVKKSVKKSTSKSEAEFEALKAELEAVKTELELLKNQKKIIRFSASADAVTYKKLTDKASDLGISISSYVRNLLREHFK